MTDIIVAESDGWSGIVAALRRAQPGDRVLIGPGRYAGDETLVVQSGVTLSGCADANLEFTGGIDDLSGITQGAWVTQLPYRDQGSLQFTMRMASAKTPGKVALQVRHAEDVTIEGLRLTAWRGLKDLDSGHFDGSMILLESTTRCLVQNCALYSMAWRGPAIVFRSSSDAKVLNNDIFGGYWGIALLSSRGLIEGNSSHHCHEAGIYLQPDPDDLNRPSDAVIRSNHCYDNGRGGVVLKSSFSEAIAGNVCRHNELSGISLERYHKSPDVPSQAIIRGNYCHDNLNAGIVLMSSVCEVIEDNECWNNNLPGILLTRFDLSPEAPSQAVIRSNRCHDNADAGVALVSSSSETIESNECWSNATSGIVLSRAKMSPHAPSSAVIRRNRCFDNQAAGVHLLSADSEAIESNDCWDNGLSGIVLARCELTPGKPSRSVIRVNRCHHNADSGILLGASNSDSIEGNECWSNERNGISIEGVNASPVLPSVAALRMNFVASSGASAIQFVASTGSAEGNLFKDNCPNDVLIEKPRYQSNFPSLELAGNVLDDTLDLPALFLPKLRAALAEAWLPTLRSRPSSDEGLAGFLISGSAGSFRTFWTGLHHAPEPVQDAGHLPESRRWRLTQISGDTMAPPERLPVLPAGLVATLIGQATRAEAGKANWCALVISDEIDSEDICHAFESRANAESADYVAAGERSGAPVRVEMEGDEATLHERLSTALMAGKSSRAERWGLLARLALWPAIVVAVMAVGFWLSPWSPLAKVVFSKFDFWAWVGTLFAGISGFLAVFSFLDLFMPRHLRAGETGTAAILSDGAKNVLDDRVSSLLETISRLIPQSKRDAWVEQADLNWQRKQLFGKADIATIYLSDVTCWRKGDLAWLSMLGRSLSGYQKLNVLIELDGRLSLRPLLLEPLEVPWKDGIDLYLFDDVDKLRLEEPDEMSGKPEDHIVGLFGAQVPDASKMINELIDDNWCPTDMVATLPIASAPTHRMRLVSKNVDDEGLLADSALVKEMYPAARALFTSGRDELPVSLDSVKRLVGHAYRARALHCTETGRFNSIVGRAGYRRKVAGLMRGIWTQSADDSQNLLDWGEYVASALRFGIWHAVTDAAKALETHLSKEASLKIRRTFEAVRFLGEDLEYIMAGSPPVHGEQEVYGPAWQRLRSCMASLADGPEVPTIIGAWLGAEELCFGALPDVIEEWQLRIEVLMADPIACDAARAKTAGEAFCIATARQLIDLQQLDPVSRRHSLDRAESTIWRGYPDSLLDRFWKWANGRGANSKSLAMLFSDARDAETIEKLIRMHRRNPLRTVYALANAATNHIIADHLDDGALLTFDERMPLVARTLAEFRMMWIDKWGDKAVQLSREFAQGASGAAVTAQSAYDFMTREGASAQILELLTPDGMAVLEDLEGQFELELVA